MISDLGLLSVLILTRRGTPDQSDPPVATNLGEFNELRFRGRILLEIAWALGVYEPILQRVFFPKLRSNGGGARPGAGPPSQGTKA